MVGIIIRLEWYYQFFNEVIDVRVLVNVINDYFISFIDDFVFIVYFGLQLVYEDFFVFIVEVVCFLLLLNMLKVIGFDNFFNCFFKEFVLEFVLVI